MQLYGYLFIMNKTLRQRAVLDVLKHGSIASQEDLQRLLRKRGFKVGQAILSRDIRDLNLSKTSHGYSLPQGESAAGIALPPVSRLVREFVLDIRSAQNQLVIKTIVGSAQPVAAALDEADWSEVVGTIAGDDTILIVCPDKDDARELAGRIEERLANTVGRLKTALLGATGYSGLELTRILLRHPRLEKPTLLRRSADNGHALDLADVFPVLSGNGGYPLHSLSWPVMKQQGVELLFLATPHEASRSLVPEAISHGLRVVDLSGAWRLKQEQHRAIYTFQDSDTVTAAQLTEKAVYGLPELNSDRIANAPLVA